MKRSGPEARVREVPETVIFPSGVSVCAPIIYSLPDIAEIRWVSKLKTGGLVLKAKCCGLSCSVLLLTTKLVLSSTKEYWVPETVMARPPGAGVCDSNTEFEKAAALETGDGLIMTSGGATVFLF